VRENFAKTGFVAATLCGFGLIRGGDYDLLAHDNDFRECSRAAFFAAGRFARGKSIGPHRHTCPQEWWPHPGAPVSGVAIEGDQARGTVAESGGFAGWVNLSDIYACDGVLDVHFSTGDSNYARKTVHLSHPAGGALTQAVLVSQYSGTISAVELQLAADRRTLQARAATTQTGASHEWSFGFDGTRFLINPPVAIDRRTDA
jgi:hypothetical protein